MNLPRVFLTAGEHQIQVYVARSDEERAQGLMFRREMPEDEGMLFMCDECAVLKFWMKDTPLPLSIAFLDEDGTILKISDLEPHDLEGESSEHPVRFVLEVNQGWFAQRGIGEGARLTGPLFLERA
ncbi:DUF192 domain-containing protein [Ramlibacter pallidus]|uniref:DUF192 domain-containing protein n=1 Tax=Ramlibacter pallidus TaxID=2780087 RepID=A0ABR9S851_9BURK|nr:DUF192 domain-containing protein [Ramlibacter pallidus]MBE7369663.1 DUF192 domain-containing protein [Ramlibacter pallidus]